MGLRQCKGAPNRIGEISKSISSPNLASVVGSRKSKSVSRGRQIERERCGGSSKTYTRSVSQPLILKTEKGRIVPTYFQSASFEHHHFKMEGMNSVMALVQRNDYMIKIDLKDAYFCLAVAEEQQRFLRFQWGGGGGETSPVRLSQRAESVHKNLEAN